MDDAPWGDIHDTALSILVAPELPLDASAPVRFASGYRLSASNTTVWWLEDETVSCGSSSTPAYLPWSDTHDQLVMPYAPRIYQNTYHDFLTMHPSI